MTHLSELKGIETFNTLCDTVAGNEVQSLGDPQVEVNAKAPDKQMADWQAEVKVEKLGYAGQRRK